MSEKITEEESERDDSNKIRKVLRGLGMTVK